jgi:hypothetical protein
LNWLWAARCVSQRDFIHHMESQSRKQPPKSTRKVLKKYLKRRGWGDAEGGIETRRRPIGRDYAVAKDAASGLLGATSRRELGIKRRRGDGESGRYREKEIGRRDDGVTWSSREGEIRAACFLVWLSYSPGFLNSILLYVLFDFYLKRSA